MFLMNMEKRVKIVTGYQAMEVGSMISERMLRRKEMKKKELDAYLDQDGNYIPNHRKLINVMYEDYIHIFDEKLKQRDEDLKNEKNAADRLFPELDEILTEKDQMDQSIYFALISTIVEQYQITYAMPINMAVMTAVISVQNYRKIRGYDQAVDAFEYLMECGRNSVLIYMSTLADDTARQREMVIENDVPAEIVTYVLKQVGDLYKREYEG